MLNPVGELAIERFFEKAKFADVVGKGFNRSVAGREVTAVPLLHLSGATASMDSAGN